MMNRAYEATSFADVASQLLGRARGDRRKRGGRHATHEPVWGGSKEAGGPHEEAFLARLDDSGRRSRRTAAAVAFEHGRELLVRLRRERREPTPFEAQCMAITASSVRVYEALLRMERLFRGKVIPSYERIAEWAHVSRATVARAVNALEAIGLLARLRRYIYHKDPVAGARSEQTSNAYRLELPRKLVALFDSRSRRRPAPLPDCERHRAQEHVREHADMLRTLSRPDYIRATTESPGVALALISLFEAGQEAGWNGARRESQKDTVTRPILLNR